MDLLINAGALRQYRHNDNSGFVTHLVNKYEISMKKVTHVDDHKPHLTVNCGESVHIVPVALIEDVINGKRDFTQLEKWDVLLKTILKDWLSSVRE